MGLLFFQKFVSYLGATLLWDLNSDSFLLNFEVVEEMSFQGHTIELCIFKDGRFVERGGLTIQVCGKLVCLRLTGDMSFIYKLLGHSSGFRHDRYRCIYCKHDFKTGEEGPMRDIMEFNELAEKARQHKNVKETFNICNEPILKVPLFQVVPFLLHVFLGLFQRSMDCFKMKCRQFDLRIKDPATRNPSTFQYLETELEKSNEELQEAIAVAADTQTDKTNVQDRIAEIAGILEPIHANWKRADALRIVQRKMGDDSQEFEEFRAFQETAMELLLELTEEEKNLTEANKHVTELKKQIGKLKDEIKKVQGPLEYKAAFVVQWKLGLKGNVWWGNFIGPDIVSFLTHKNIVDGEPTEEDTKPKYQELLACIDQEALTHLELLSANDKVDGDTLQEIRAMLAAYADMWELFSLFFFKVKHAGDVDEQRMQEIKNLHPRFCSIFKQVCGSEGKEPSPT